MIRFLSLDVFRGLTIALMILVNSPGLSATYACLEHSQWNGCTLADLVFPFFIVIVGVSSVCALTHLKQKSISNHSLMIKITKRTLYLFMMGLLLNAFPHHFDFSTIRILGVLQRIAICYFCAAFLFLTTKPRTQAIIISALLMSYWLFLSWFSTTPSLTIDHNLVGYVDQWIFSSQHLYSPPFDPEGLLSTLPAIASALIGNLLGICLVSSRTPAQKLQWMIWTGLILSTLGVIWNPMFPFNKPLWSSAYVLWTGGLAVLTYSACFTLIEIKQWHGWSKPFALFGRSAMLVYVLHVLFLKIQALMMVSHHHHQMNLRMYLTELLFGSFSPKNASLCYAVSYTLFWLFVLKCIEQWRYSGDHNMSFNH